MRIIERHAWGARYADSYRGYNASLPKRWGYLHHPVTSSAGRNATFEEDAWLIRHIESIGQNRFGYGISYSFPITQSGRIFRGHRTNGVGTHTAGYNSSTLAICFVGNYDEHHPTEEQMDAAAWLMRHGYEQGWTTDFQLAGGHRDLKATACPGINAYNKIDEINRRAREFEDMPSADEIARAVWSYPLHKWDGPGDDNVKDRMHAGQQLNQSRGFARAGYGRVNRRTSRLIDLAKRILGKDPVDVDALADALAPKLNQQTAKELADEIARRMAE